MVKISPTYHTIGYYRVDGFVCTPNIAIFQFDGDFSLALIFCLADVISGLHLSNTIVTWTPRDVEL